MSTLISCHNLTKSYRDQPLFDGISLHIQEGERIGLIGRNGSGKTTLLRILAGRETADGGERLQRKRLRSALVDQDPDLDPEATVQELVLQALEALPPDVDRDVQASITLSRLGFGDPGQRVGTLSGGWRKRLALAQALAGEPDLLLLDEPTNHLDLEGILWLETFLKSSRQAFLMVSHDRAFLQEVATRVMELDPRFEGGLLSVDGRYSDFLEKRQDLLAGQAQHQASLRGKVDREVEWLRRGPKARTTKAQGRIKEAQRLIEELANLRARGSGAGSRVGIEFAGSGRKTKRLLTAVGLAKALGGRRLFDDVGLILRPGMRLGLVGANGTGKTTLLRILLGELQADEGDIVRAEGLRVVYFDQQREQLDRSLPLRRALAEEGDLVIYQGRPIHVAGWAKRFLFRPEQLDTPISSLSGGEQAKILIARLMLQPADLLLLDEPTNDLDIPTLEILEESLAEFPGALVMVTHDRYLMDRVTTGLLGLDGEGGATIVADYMQWEQVQAERKKQAQPRQAALAPKAKPRRAPKALTTPERREYEAMEETITEAEERLEEASQALEDPSVISDAQKVQERYAAYQAAQARVDSLYARWAELEAKLRAGEG